MWFGVCWQCCWGVGWGVAGCVVGMLLECCLLVVGVQLECSGGCFAGCSCCCCCVVVAGMGSNFEAVLVLLSLIF